MATKNDITGDAIRSKGPSKAFEDGFDLAFRDKSRQAHGEATQPQQASKVAAAPSRSDNTQTLS